MNKIITISREFGSGGREVGKRLADELGFAYYDSEIITRLASETGLSKQYIKDISEKGIYPYPFQFGKTFSGFNKLPSNQSEVLIAQQRIIKEIAIKGNCVIVGRGADVILRDYNPMNLFVYASLESKIKRCKKKATKGEKLVDSELERRIKKVDKNRKKYYDLLSNQNWGDKENYSLCLNTTNIEIKTIIKPLASYIKNWFKEDVR